MAEMPFLQEQKTADRRLWRKCRFCRSKKRRTARADNCSCIVGIPAIHGGQMAEMPFLQE